MDLNEHILIKNTTQDINKSIIEIAEQYKEQVQNFDDNNFNNNNNNTYGEKPEQLDLLKIITDKASEVSSNGSPPLKSRILESLFTNDDIVEQSSIYNTSDTLKIFQYNSLIRDGFITLAGFSSSGKTSFAIQMGLDILKNNKNTVLVVYSLDDSKAFLKKKMYKQLLDDNRSVDISFLNPVENSILKYSGYLDNNIIERIHILDNINLFKDVNAIDIYRDLQGIENYHNNIENLKLIVVIDYIQILEHDSINIREGLNRACKELKNIQKSFNCMLIALSQLSNEGNYRETSEIRNISDIIIKQYSEKEYVEKVLKKNYTENNNNMNFVFTVEKNKAGIKGMIYRASINSNFIFSNFIDNYSYKNNAAQNNSYDLSELNDEDNPKFDSLGNKAKKIYAANFFETDKFIIYDGNEYNQNEYYIKKGYKTKANKSQQYFIGKKMVLPESKDFRKYQIWVFLKGEVYE